MIVVIMAMAMFVMALASISFAAEGSASASTSVMSRYVWRGFTFSEGAVYQPSVDINLGNFNANIWANIDPKLDDTVYTSDSNMLNETDITLAYSIPVEGLSLSVGMIYYSLIANNDASDTTEFYVSIAKEFGPVAPYISIYRDVDDGSGWYAVLGADYAREISDKASLSAGASVSYVSDNNLLGTDSNGKENSALHNADAYVSLSYAVSDTLSIEPIVAYTSALSDDSKAFIEAASVDGNKDLLYGGLTLSMGF